MQIAFESQGRPLPGLIWDKFCQKQVLSEGFEKIPGWECLYVHIKKKLFLSVYVHDFKKAGDAKHIPDSGNPYAHK